MTTQTSSYIPKDPETYTLARTLFCAALIRSDHAGDHDMARTMADKLAVTLDKGTLAINRAGDAEYYDPPGVPPSTKVGGWFPVAEPGEALRMVDGTPTVWDEVRRQAVMVPGPGGRNTVGTLQLGTGQPVPLTLLTGSARLSLLLSESRLDADVKRLVIQTAAILLRRVPHRLGDAHMAVANAIDQVRAASTETAPAVATQNVETPPDAPAPTPRNVASTSADVLAARLKAGGMSPAAIADILAPG